LAELILEMTRRAKEGAMKAELVDAAVRFQSGEIYCERAMERLQDELESKRCIDSLTKVSYQ
jgi:hypothetical protein